MKYKVRDVAAGVLKFKLWQSADMQEPVKLIKANSYKKALELALEVCGYTLTQGDKDEIE